MCFITSTASYQDTHQVPLEAIGSELRHLFLLEAQPEPDDKIRMLLQQLETTLETDIETP